jgi:hypothetical protein
MGPAMVELDDPGVSPRIDAQDPGDPMMPADLDKALHTEVAQVAFELARSASMHVPASHASMFSNSRAIEDDRNSAHLLVGRAGPSG